MAWFIVLEYGLPVEMFTLEEPGIQVFTELVLVEVMYSRCVGRCVCIQRTIGIQ